MQRCVQVAVVVCEQSAADLCEGHVSFIAKTSLRHQGAAAAVGGAAAAAAV